MYVYIPPFFSSAYCIKSLCWESNLHEAPRGFRFIGDKETHIRTTSQEFDSSDFIGYLKGRSEMTSLESGFTGLILIKLHKKAAATAIRYFF